MTEQYKEKRIKSNRVYTGKIVDVYNDTVLLENNTYVGREYVEHKGGVCVIGFKDNKIILERQYRYVKDNFLLEIPAGRREVNESWEEAAKREFEEETGYKVSRLVSLGTVTPDCGFLKETLHLYYAEELTDGKLNLDNGENIKLEFYTLEEVLKLIEEDKIIDARTICTIFKYMLKVGFIK